MKQQALASGVPEGAILIDEEARNTQQNAENAQNLITENDYGDVILVTSGYHQRRADLEFEKRAEGVTIRNYPIQDSDWHWFWWLTPRGWWLAGGEMAKIIAFYLGVSS
ncbi:YdcF family protein [Candidatus Saccharibacteria bacterium]|nr:YdcF family protein [Candidatus Saccharibacteria bacterium]